MVTSISCGCSLQCRI